MSAVAKGSLEALDELKSTDRLISASLKNELDGKRKQYKTLQLDYDQQKTQLIDALLSKEKLRKEVEESVKEPPLASPKVADTPGSVVDQAAVDELVRKSNEKIEKLRDRVKLQKEVGFPQPAMFLAWWYLTNHILCFAATRKGRSGEVRPATAAQGCRTRRSIVGTKGQ